MNFHKNYYKLCLPSLMATLAIILLGVAFALIFGFNTSSVTPYSLGGTILYLSVYLMAASVFAIIYLRVRYNWSTGFVVVLKNFVDVILLISIIAVVRIPLTLETVMACVLTTVFGNFTALYLLKQANKNLSTENNAQKLNNNLIQANIVKILVFGFIVMVLMAMLIGTSLPNILSFSLGAIVGVVVSCFTSLFVLVPVWLGFIKREYRLKQKFSKTEQIIDNKKVEINQETSKDNATSEN